MKLIVGLGNPESRYDGTRHNIGFMMLDSYADSLETDWQHKAKFKADIAELPGPQKALLVKPRTYYNLSGEAVRAIADFYKVDSCDILVVHDELAIDFGTLRTRYKGSHAGNNGIKSITQHIGETTARLRVGIYTPHREEIDDAEFVLSKLTASEKKILGELQPIVTTIIDSFIDGSFTDTTYR